MFRSASVSQKSRVKLGLLSLLLVLLALSACQDDSPASSQSSNHGLQDKNVFHLTVPLGLEMQSASFNVPKDNLLTEEKIRLGKRLFFEKALSADGHLSCASCHVPEKGFSDPRQFSLGVKGQKGKRQAPAIINRAFSRKQFWDGRAASLEEQALGPMLNPIEMGNPEIRVVLQRLQKDASYVTDFKLAFPEENDAINEISLSRALASFERTIMSGNSAYDRFAQHEDKSAMSEAAFRGYQLFLGKAGCASCHVGFNFTDESYHNLGIGIDAKKMDPGRFAVTKMDGHQGAFKTPSLRDVAKTAPYMNNGSLKTLEAVVAFYNQGGNLNQWISPKLKPLKLTAQEQQDLVEFMKALSGEIVWYGKAQDELQAAQNRPLIKP